MLPKLSLLSDEMILGGADKAILGPPGSTKIAIEFENGSVWHKVWRRFFRSNLLQQGFLELGNEARIAGKTDSQLKWNSEETFGRKLGKVLIWSGKMLQFSSLQEKALISYTHLVETKTIFRVRYHIELYEYEKKVDSNNLLRRNGEWKDNT